MKKRTRSILEEINSMAPRTTKDQVVEMRSQNVLSGAIQLLEYIEKNFDETVQADLRKRSCSVSKTKI